MHINSNIFNFFKQNNITEKSIDDFFGPRFSLKKISRNSEEASAFLLNINNISVFSYLIDKLFSNEKAPLSLISIINNKVSNKNEKLSVIINKIKQDKSFFVDKNIFDFIFLSSYINQENHITKNLLENYYYNDLSLIRENSYHDFLLHNFIMNNDKLLSFIIRYHYKPLLDDLSFLTHDHIIGSKIIDLISPDLTLNTPFSININCKFDEPAQIKPKHNFDYHSLFNKPNLSVSRPDIITTLPVIMLKKGYPVKTIHNYLSNDTDNFIYHGSYDSKDIINKITNFSFHNGHPITEVTNDLHKWEYWIINYPNAKIDNNTTLFVHCLELLSEFNSKFNGSEEKDILNKIVDILNKALDKNDQIDFSHREHSLLYFLHNNTNNITLTQKIIEHPIFNDNDQDKKFPLTLLSKFLDLSQNSLIKIPDFMKKIYPNYDMEKQANKNKETQKALENTLSAYLSKSKAINDIKHFSFNNELLEKAVSNPHINKDQFFENTISAYFTYHYRETLTKEYNIDSYLETILTFMDNHYSTVDLIPVLDNTVIGLSNIMHNIDKSFSIFSEFRNKKYQENSMTSKLNKKIRL